MLKTWCLLLFVLPSFICLGQSDYKTYYEKAKADEKAKNYPSAIINYTIAIQIDSIRIDAYYHRGLTKFHLPDFAGAIQDFNKVIELCLTVVKGKEKPEMREDKYYAYGYFYRAEAECQLFKYRLAVIDYSQAMDKGIDSLGDAYNGRGRAKKSLDDYYQGDYGAAIQDFDKGIQLEPGKAFGYYYRGLAEYSLKNYGAALKDILQSTTLDTADADKYFWLGMAENKLKSYPLAVESFSKCIGLNPAMDRAYENRGLAEMALNRYDNVYTDLMKAAKIKNSNALGTPSFLLGPE